MRVNIYTHSGIHGMKKKVGYIWYVLEAETEKGPVAKAEKVKIAESTENQAELYALLLAVRRLTKQVELHIYTDSAYVAAGWKQDWLKNWKKNNWRTAKGEPVAFAQFWQELGTRAAAHHVEIHLKEQHSYNSWFESEERRNG